VADPEHRFFLFAHFYDVHSDFKTDVPYFAPPPYDLMFLPGGLNWKHRGDSALLQELYKSGKVTPEDRRILTALYDGGVRYCDEKGVGPLLEKLRELKFDDDTLVIITSDHGEEIFEHGESIHQQPYEETSRVPLVFKGPGIPRGLRLPYLAELVDLMPTVLSHQEGFPYVQEQPDRRAGRKALELSEPCRQGTRSRGRGFSAEEPGRALRPRQGP
jgi:arylsulfatase A-like enzyme